MHQILKLTRSHPKDIIIVIMFILCLEMSGSVIQEIYIYRYNLKRDHSYSAVNVIICYTIKKVLFFQENFLVNILETQVTIMT